MTPHPPTGRAARPPGSGHVSGCGSDGVSPWVCSVCFSDSQHCQPPFACLGATFIPSFLSPPTSCPLLTDRAACLLPTEWEEFSLCPAHRFSVRYGAPLHSLPSHLTSVNRRKFSFNSEVQCADPSHCGPGYLCLCRGNPRSQRSAPVTSAQVRHTAASGDSRPVSAAPQGTIPEPALCFCRRPPSPQRHATA